ncbi:hypothetical protein DdX_02000 [Ditylenchus destructor]|uniref:Uncharacterized protein n=1 Tax=Ditylenchus destructor TaxID=166010 RepID=A0AAD4RBP0_9BILA|nr:hypothetical protein DdX_02000 [Ditylenchus destructor]
MENSFKSHWGKKKLKASDPVGKQTAKGLAAFQKVKDDLDAVIDAATEEFYSDLLRAIDKIISTTHKNLGRPKRHTTQSTKKSKHASSPSRNEKDTTQLGCALESVILTDKERKSPRKNNRLPVLFIRGQCANWTSIQNHIESEHTHCKFLLISASDAKPMILIQNALEKKPQSLFVLLRQPESLENNGLLENIIEILHISHVNTYLAINSTENPSAVCKRISRHNCTAFDARIVELGSPADLLDGIMEKLLFRADTQSQLRGLRLSGELLNFTRGRYLFQNYSIVEFRKCLVCAVLMHCTASEACVNQINKTWMCVSPYKHFLQGMSCLLDYNPKEMSFEDYLHVYCNLESGEFLKVFKENKPTWKRSAMKARLRQLLVYLEQDKLLVTQYGSKCKEIISSLEVDDDQNMENRAPTKSTAGKNRPTKSAAEYMKDQSRSENKNKVTDQLAKQLLNFVEELLKCSEFEKREMMVTTDEKHSVFLRASTDTEFQSALNQSANKRCGSGQLDICTICRLIVHFNTMASHIPLSGLFEVFKGENSFQLNDCDIDTESRFFNAIAYLDYVGVINCASEGFIKLLSPLPVFAFSTELFS